MTSWGTGRSRSRRSRTDGVVIIMTSGSVHHEVVLEQLLVGGQRAPVLPHAVDQAVVVEAEEEAVHVRVVAPPTVVAV